MWECKTRAERVERARLRRAPPSNEWRGRPPAPANASSSGDRHGARRPRPLLDGARRPRPLLDGARGPRPLLGRGRASAARGGWTRPLRRDTRGSSVGATPARRSLALSSGGGRAGPVRSRPVPSRPSERNCPGSPRSGTGQDSSAVLFCSRIWKKTGANVRN